MEGHIWPFLCIFLLVPWINTCLLYIGPLLGNLVWNESGFLSLFLIMFVHMHLHISWCLKIRYCLIFIYLIFASQIVFWFFTKYSVVLSFQIKVILMLSIEGILVTSCITFWGSLWQKFHKNYDISIISFFCVREIGRQHNQILWFKWMSAIFPIFPCQPCKYMLKVSS